MFFFQNFQNILFSLKSYQTLLAKTRGGIDHQLCLKRVGASRGVIQANARGMAITPAKTAITPEK